MKIGDVVRVIGVPVNLPEPARMVFERSVGRIFSVVDVTPEGLIELEVGEAVGMKPYLHSIWIEPEHLVPAETSN